ncbi:MAG TPA: hypothetical protein PKD64_03625 [Pirellulaceae bacterium]|nr:hypothetical protein [Pirellulaceae bacterium]HMO91260.1 hypothetical protein [Pirellulaceae bacterium]HMP68556.1 hypothetical protein [Pirellulaceae bacterium]
MQRIFADIGLLVIGLAWLLGFQPAFAEEPAERFLRALRDSHNYDIALDYLDQMQTSALVSESFKVRVPIEKATTLMASVQRTREPQKREQALDQAQQVLDQFLATNPAAELKSEAQRSRANLLMTRANLAMDSANNSRLTVQQASQLREQARDFLNKAATSFEENRTELANEIRRLGQPGDDKGKSRLEELRKEFVLIRRMSPSVKEKLADTYGEESPEYRRLLAEAAKEYEKIFEDYSNYAGGLDAALFAARCHLKLGNHDEALSNLTVNVFSQENVPAFYELKRHAALVALNCWEAKQPYPYNDIIYYLGPIVKDIRPNDRSRVDWLQIQLGLAKACMAKSEAIRAERPSSAEERKSMNDLKSTAIEIAKFVSKVNSPQREPARQLLLSWDSRVGELNETREPPKTVAEARDQIREMVSEIEDTNGRIKSLESQIRTGTIEPTAAEEQMRELKQGLSQQVDQALQTIELAFGLADDTTLADDLSYIRYLQTYCYFQLGQYWEVTVIGRFLLDRYPDRSGAREAMGLVCRAYWQLMSTVADGEKGYEREQLKHNCAEVVNRWPGTTEAESAAQLLTIVAVQEGDLGTAEHYIQFVPVTSPNRPSLILSLGQGLWQNYVSQQRQGASNEQLSSLRGQAKQFLLEGADSIELSVLTPFQARNLLSIAELHLDEGNVDAALERLEKADIAPLDLVKQKHPAANDGNFRLDTYRTAVRAYLAALQKGENTQAWIEKAQSVIDALAGEFANQPDGQKKLVAVYYRLANELKTQFDAIEDAQQKQTFGRGLDVFLTGVAQNSQDVEVLVWCGSTMTNVGEALFQSGHRESGRALFEKAIKVFDQVANRRDIDETMNRTMLRRKAIAYRGMGEFEQAINMFEKIFNDTQNIQFIDLQIDAATTFQEWGVAKKNDKALLQAVSGGIPVRDSQSGRQRNGAIGWKQIATITQRNRDKGDAQRQLYYQAIFHFAQCKYEYAKLTSNGDVMKSAMEEVTNFLQRESQVDSQWKSKFDSLASSIRAAMQ